MDGSSGKAATHLFTDVGDIGVHMSMLPATIGMMDQVQLLLLGKPRLVGLKLGVQSKGWRQPLPLQEEVEMRTKAEIRAQREKLMDLAVESHEKGNPLWREAPLIAVAALDWVLDDQEDPTWLDEHELGAALAAALAADEAREVG